MIATIVRDWASVDSLQHEWERLLACAPGDCMFLTWPWLESWQRIAGHSFRPCIVTVRSDAGELLGILPLYEAELRLVGGLRYRTLRFIADHATGAEYPDWIFAPSCWLDVLQGTATALEQSGLEWHCLWLPNVADWTGARARFEALCDMARWRINTRPRAFAAISVPSAKDTYFGQLSAKKRKRLREESKRFGVMSDVHIVRCDAESERLEMLEALFSLHRARWQSRGEEGTFTRKPTEALFYQTFTAPAMARGWLRLFGLKDATDWRAIQIGYRYRDRFYAIQEGFDPTFVEGAGNYLRRKVFEACIEEGVQEIDFLGDFTEHKRRWGATERLGSDLLIGRRSVRTLPLFVRPVWPTGRFLSPVVERSETS